jgi:hypothetical protein
MAGDAAAAKEAGAGAGALAEGAGLDAGALEAVDLLDSSLITKTLEQSIYQ